jgi:hypothetical protein
MLVIKLIDLFTLFSGTSKKVEHVPAVQTRMVVVEYIANTHAYANDQQIDTEILYSNFKSTPQEKQFDKTLI